MFNKQKQENNLSSVTFLLYHPKIKIFQFYYKYLILILLRMVNHLNPCRWRDDW